MAESTPTNDVPKWNTAITEIGWYWAKPKGYSTDKVERPVEVIKVYKDQDHDSFFIERSGSDHIFDVEYFTLFLGPLDMPEPK